MFSFFRSSCCGLGKIQRRINIKKMFVCLFLFSAASYLCLTWSTSENKPRMRRRLTAHNFCPAVNRSQLSRPPDDLKVWGPKNRNSAHVLILSRGPASDLREVKDLLAASRIKYKVSSPGKSLPELTKVSRGGTGKYFVIVFEDMSDYYFMDTWNREILDKYCDQFKAGIVGFVPSGMEQVKDEPMLDPVNNFTSDFTISSHLRVEKVGVLQHQLLKILKAGVEVELSNNISWVGFGQLGDSAEPVIVSRHTTRAGVITETPLVIYQPTNIRKVLIGGSGSMEFWLIKLVFLDAVQFLANKQLMLPLTRYVMVDIDDVFVGVSRLTKDDVTALVDSQDRLAEQVKGFRYNLGFSGGYFLMGNDEEDLGDQELIIQSNEFWWFPHMWKHMQAHKYTNVSYLVAGMELNKAFAADKGIPVEGEYSVAPHHSGVFPVHQPLYDAWKQVWNIGVTSTEEYPNLRPAKRRRGFIHSGVSVLPRQTCGLYTKNLFYDEYPGSPRKLESSIKGGELFQTLVTNPISIFMTHMPNYCYDRLAEYTFESVVNFASCYTNLDLRTVSPRQLSDKYFQLFPEEVNPIWSNPCKDKRHLEIWSVNKSCSRLPNLVIIGPQKTGTTALHTFLKLHPNVIESRPSTETFEEVQFFNTKNYLKGLDWYQDFFPPKNSSMFLFEKSATYFDGELVPLRAHKLLPDAKIVTILLRPEARAYSWYQHIRAHSDTTALNHSFKEVLMAGPDSPRPLLSLQARCLEPGKYAQHLDKWLAFYRPKQLHIIDGDELKVSPVGVMNQLQHFAELPFVDYKDKLVLDKRKGFYCQLIDGKKKCLGKGKGRVYPEMDSELEDWLRGYYKPHNAQLRTLLLRHGYTLPAWLKLEAT